MFPEKTKQRCQRRSKIVSITKRSILPKTKLGKLRWGQRRSRNSSIGKKYFPSVRFIAVRGQPLKPRDFFGITRVFNNSCFEESAALKSSCLAKQNEALWGHNFKKDIQADGASMTHVQTALATSVTDAFFGYARQNKGVRVCRDETGLR